MTFSPLMAASMAPHATGDVSGAVPSASSPPPRSPIWIDVGLIAACVIWGVNFSVIKVALVEIEPLAFNALRFPLAAVTMFVLLRMQGPIPLPKREDLVSIVLLGLLGNIVYQYFFIIGIDRTLAGNAALVLSTVPVWTLILSILTGQERPTSGVWIGVLGTLAGMALVVLGGARATGRSEGPGGGLLLVAAAITWAIYTVGCQTLTRRYGALALTSWTLWIGTVVLVALGVPSLARMDVGSISLMAWVGVAFAGVLAIAVAYLLWNYGVEHLGSARTAVFQNLVPIAALITAFLWLDEHPTLLQVIGATIIIGGTWTARTARTRKLAAVE